ncbi:flagellar protein FliT [Litoribacillus peritrichatus]|uniref:Flagellar protein FliT n=1 Tax=Litoribacillus peritrichatus TaxID=718191 RepID=A0ABP7M2F5_9GAMM
MTDVTKRIADVQQAMRLALSNDDWEELSTLDLKCRTLVEEAVADASRNQIIVRDAIIPLLELYKHAVAACEAHRDQIAAELKGFNRQKTSAQAYQNCQF